MELKIDMGVNEAMWCYKVIIYDVENDYLVFNGGCYLAESEIAVFLGMKHLFDDAYYAFKDYQERGQCIIFDD